MELVIAIIAMALFLWFWLIFPAIQEKNEKIRQDEQRIQLQEEIAEISKNTRKLGEELEQAKESIRPFEGQLILPSDDLSFLPKEFVAIDLETTGLDRNHDEIIQFAAVRFRFDSEEQQVLTAYVNTSLEINDSISNLTGIRQMDIENEGVELELAVEELDAFLGDSLLVAHNAMFHFSFLRRAFASFGKKIENPIICTLQLARESWSEEPSYKLRDLADKLMILSPSTHGAVSDCRMVISVFLYAAANLGDSFISWPLVNQVSDNIFLFRNALIKRRVSNHVTVSKTTHWSITSNLESGGVLKTVPSLHAARVWVDQLYDKEVKTLTRGQRDIVEGDSRFQTYR